MKTIQTGTKYIDFLKTNDDNFATVKGEIENIWDVLTKNYLVEAPIYFQFETLYGSKDDVFVYEKLLTNFKTLIKILNELIDEFNLNAIIEVETSDDYKPISFELPESLRFSRKYIDLINTDWMLVGNLIAKLNASLIYYHYKEEK